MVLNTEFLYVIYSANMLYFIIAHYVIPYIYICIFVLNYINTITIIVSHYGASEVT